MKGKSVFIIDNNIKFLESAVNFLDRCPEISSVGWGESLETSIERISNLPPQIIFININLPKINGLEISKFLKSRSNPPEVYLISINDEKIYEEEAIIAGADGFISKNNFATLVRELLKKN